MHSIKSDIFIKKCSEMRDNRYDYSQVDYVNNKTKVKIICGVHGIFEQTPNNHLSKSQDCPKCSEIHFKRLTNKDFILDAIKIHGNNYDYSLVRYKDNKSKVKIVCRKHGTFEQSPNNHLSKSHGCPKCSNKFVDTIIFIDRSNKTHSNRYDYSCTSYINMQTKVNILCKKHGEFSQMPHSHLYGVGCPKCKESKGELEIAKILKEINVEYIGQHKFENCRNKKPLRFDFYLPNKNICIEYNGYQHYNPVKYFGGEKFLKIQKERDRIKREYCELNNITLIEIKYKENIKRKILECIDSNT